MSDQTSQAAADRRGVTSAQQEREAAKRPPGRSLRPLAYLVPYVFRYPVMLSLAVAMLLVAAGATLVMPLAVRRVIDTGFTEEAVRTIDRAFILMLGVAGLLALSSAARFFFVSWMGERVVADLRKAVYDHVTKLSPAFYEVTQTVEVVTRLTADTTLIQTIVGSSVSIALRNSLMLVGSIVLLFVTSPRLAGIVLLALPVIVPLIILGRFVRRLSRRSQDRLAGSAAIAAESLGAIRTVQAFTHEEYDRARFSDATETVFRTAIWRISARSLMTATMIFFIFASIVSVIWTGARTVSSGTMSGGQLVQFMLYALFMAGAVGALSEVWGDMLRAAGATERLVELLHVTPKIRAPENPVAMPEPPRGALYLDAVTFRYPARPDVSALEDFSLEVAPGETVALVGPSGAGKTTVFQLLLRFYDVSAGQVLVDGCAVTDVVPQDLRRRIGLVAQDPVVFATSAMENIRYGRPDASDEEVVAAAKAAAAHEFIMELPRGYATELGERGATLSGGQRQRIAIARAILRDAPILLLDEATSALDAESEQLVQQALETVMKGRTTLVIAHRLATVQKVDRIVVMDRGRVVAQGSHAELVAQGGLYARLAALQFREGGNEAEGE